MAEDAGPADRVLVITGPTAAGKTALALDVAGRLGAEIISADSRQVYRGMDIGTAKATAEERARVPHHGLDLVDPSARYSAGRFAADARRWIREIVAQGRVPMLVGGTGFFIRALTNPLFREPPLDPDRRQRLHRFLDHLGQSRLDAWLDALDPTGAGLLRERGGGKQRALRLLEVALLTGRPLGWWQRHEPATVPPLHVEVFVLGLPRQQLYDRINARVDAMFEAGLVAEVRGLMDRGYGATDPGMTATGYQETLALVRREISMDEAKDRIRRATRRYARRQLTWFRHQLPSGAVWLDGTRPNHQLVDEVIDQWRSAT
jgi:tRNA dimethylallyltransferase